MPDRPPPGRAAGGRAENVARDNDAVPGPQRA